jgi:hypothetical protein
MNNFSFLKRVVVLLLLFGFFMPCLLQAEATDREKISRLDAHLSTIEQEARTGRLTGGWIMVGSGIFLGGGGIILSELLLHSRTDKIIVDSLSGGAGLLFIGIGVLILALPGEAETLPQEYSALPQLTDQELTAKVMRGEVILETLAKKAESGRILASVILIGTGVAEAVTYLVTGNSIYGTDYYSPYQYSILGTALTNCVTGIISLILKSRPEQEWDSYTNWKKGSLAHSGPVTNSTEVAVVPTFSGFSVKLKMYF